MTLSVKHGFTSAKDDGPDSNQVQPSHWNAEHSISVSGPALIGRLGSGAGPAAEIPLGSGFEDQGGTLVAVGAPAFLLINAGVR